jgi:hypothetical protein
MDPLRALVVVAHVGSAFWFVIGFAAAGTLTELAIRAGTADERRSLLGVSGKFDGWFQIPGGTLVGPTGLIAVFVLGHGWTEPWVVLSLVLFAAVSFGGAVVWRNRSIRVRAALDAGDDGGVLAILGAPAVRAQSWLERAAVGLIIVLMVLRPA